jgi:hypothetical protein
MQTEQNRKMMDIISERLNALTKHWFGDNDKLSE